jgi:hypothetical protein
MDAGDVSKVSWEYVMHRLRWGIGMLFKNILEGYMAFRDRLAYNVVFFELLDLDGMVGHEFISAGGYERRPYLCPGNGQEIEG